MRKIVWARDYLVWAQAPAQLSVACITDRKLDEGLGTWLAYRQNYTNQLQNIAYRQKQNSKHASYHVNMGQVPWVPILSITRDTAALSLAVCS